MIFENIFHKVV